MEVHLAVGVQQTLPILLLLLPVQTVAALAAALPQLRLPRAPPHCPAAAGYHPPSCLPLELHLHHPQQPPPAAVAAPPAVAAAAARGCALC